MNDHDDLTRSLRERGATGSAGTRSTSSRSAAGPAASSAAAGAGSAVAAAAVWRWPCRWRSRPAAIDRTGAAAGARP